MCPGGHIPRVFPWRIFFRKAEEVPGQHSAHGSVADTESCSTAWTWQFLTETETSRPLKGGCWYATKVRTNQAYGTDRRRSVCPARRLLPAPIRQLDLTGFSR